MKLDFSGKPCRPICLLCIIAGIVLAIAAGLIIGSVCGFRCKDTTDGCKDVTVVCEGKGLCVAQSWHVAELDKEFVSVEVPPNSAITKIDVTIIQTDTIPIYAGVIQVFDPLTLEFSFETFFPKDPGDLFVTHEIDFVHPFCTGENGLTVSLVSLDSDLRVSVALELVLNVQYCPGECIINNGDGCTVE